MHQKKWASKRTAVQFIRSEDIFNPKIENDPKYKFQQFLWKVSGTSIRKGKSQQCVCVCVCVARGPGVLEEIIHNLDYCDVLVLGEELRPEQESLQLQRSTLLGKHLDATNSTSGMSIYGRLLW